MICHYYPEPLYWLFVPDLSLIYYAHIPVAALALLVGVFVYASGRKYLLNQLLFLIVLCFALWNVINMIAWTNIHSDVILFSWSFFGPLTALISILSIYFIHVFVSGKDVSVRTKAVFAALLAPVLILAPTALSLTGMNISECDAFGFEGALYEAYYNVLGVPAMLWILVVLVRSYKTASAAMKKQITLMGVGIELFLASFFFVVYLGSLLVQYGVLTDSDIEIYGLFGMVVFMVYIGVMLVRFKTFHVGLIASQALVMALVVLVASQYTFATTTTGRILTGITLALVAAVGAVLIRSVVREIRQRRHIEELAKELAQANERQVTLIHFITHQIKGFVTKSRNIFAMLRDGDYGPVPETMRPLVEEGLRSDTQGVNTIQEILNASNIKSGKVTYTKEPFDLKALIDELASALRGNAEAKGLSFLVETGTEPLMYEGDRAQLVNAFKNLIDNAVKYTQQGEVRVSLRKEGDRVVFETTDTGVGISPEDMQVLFTEGGHGKESTKVNVESTGFGLYIVRNIVEAHGGTVRAESEGVGKGSRFIVELPA